MPKGPQGQKRPADAIARAVMVAKIATGEADDISTGTGSNRALSSAGTKGGEKRAKMLTEAQRSHIAKQGAEARWKKKTN